MFPDHRSTPETRAPRVDRIRVFSPHRADRRAVLEGERDRLLEELDALDADIAERARRRCLLVERLGQLREQLWPAARFPRGRRPGSTGATDLPPLPATATYLSGRRLRSVCLALLRRAGQLTLRNLHAMLHSHGYGIESAHPVKALSDAMAYETEAGRARRLGRGLYGVSGPAPRPGRHGAPPLDGETVLPDDRLVDEVLTPAA